MSEEANFQIYIGEEPTRSQKLRIRLGGKGRIEDDRYIVALNKWVDATAIFQDGENQGRVSLKCDLGWSPETSLTLEIQE